MQAERKNKIKKIENKIKRTEPCSMRVFVQVERATKKIEHRGTL
jgi:chromosome segregation ATPase